MIAPGVYVGEHPLAGSYWYNSADRYVYYKGPDGKWGPDRVRYSLWAAARIMLPWSLPITTAMDVIDGKIVTGVRAEPVDFPDPPPAPDRSHLTRLP